MTTDKLEQRVRELTAELAAERARSRFLDAMLRSIPAGLTAVDADARQTYVNPAFAAMVGREADELVGARAPFSYWAPDAVAGIEAALATIIAAGDKALTHDWTFQRRDGERFDVEVAAAPLRDADGHQLGWCANMIDIEERERLRRDLSILDDERRRLQAAVEAAGEAIFLTDREGVFTYVNPRFTELYGYTAEEVVGKATPRILKGGTLERADYERLWQALLSGEVVRGRITNRTRTGQTVRVESSANAIRNAAGEPSGFLAIQSDVTESEQLAAELLQAQKMEAVGRLAAGVAHDFNNLLAVILNYAGFMLEDLPPGDTIREDVDEVYRAGQRAAALTRQLLLLSRQEATRPEILELGEVIETTYKMLRRTIGEDIELCVDAEAELPPIRADLGNITQVLMNLAVNARDAMPEGGRLELRTSTRTFADDAAQKLGLVPGTYAALEVTDTGSGMSPDVVSRIFEPFYTTKASGKGTGLGLSIVHRIVRELGGAVSVTSKPGKGTTFRILLPATTERVRSVSAAPVPEIGAGKTVLVIEDDDSVRAMTRRMLSRSGFSVIEARNAGEALMIAEKRATRIHFLLSDVVMPGIPGPIIARRLRAMRPELKVLFMSGYPDALRAADLEECAAAYLRKPFTRAELISKLGELEGITARDDVRGTWREMTERSSHYSSQPAPAAD